MTLTSKTAVVTGSTSGIGLAIARALAKEGANVVINGFGDADAIEKERAGLEAMSSAINTLEARTVGKAAAATEPIERYQWPLGLAVMCLLLDMVLGAVGRPGASRARTTGPRSAVAVPRSSDTIGSEMIVRTVWRGSSEP